MPNDSSAAERLFAAALYAPIGLGAKLVDDLPVAITRARQNVAFARFVGKMAVERGVEELKRRTEPAPGVTVTPTDEPHVDEPHVDEPPPPVESPVESEPPVALDDVVAADDLALPDYDQLPAAHIIGKLAGLTPSERDDVEGYELSHRHRRTVLGKLDQLKEHGPL
jgi:hypothetical protein